MVGVDPRVELAEQVEPWLHQQVTDYDPETLASLPDDLPEEEMRSLQKMDDRFGMWNDVTLSALLMLGGHALEPWDDVKQGNHPAHATAFVHNDKRWYGVRMDAEDKKLCKPQDKV